MKFVVDECVGPSVAHWLVQKGHDVFSIFDQARGVDDNFVLQKAIDENRILVTSDKDFADMVFRDKWKHNGVILFRLSDQRVENKIAKLNILLTGYSQKIPGNFIVVTETAIKFVLCLPVKGGAV